ncbi:MAG: thiamine diphosphokinase [Clostridiales bacterium]|nr:thiamine diphosphokinase [Clostridiales bacterium]
MGNNTIIISGGYVDQTFLDALFLEEQYSMVIVADRGLLVADNLKLPIDYILGDFDSVLPELLSKYKGKTTPIKIFPTKKDKTDTEIALDLALEQSPSYIHIVGATGSRMDHTMANIELLLKAMNQNVNTAIIDTNNKIYLKKDNFIIKKEKQYGDYISLIPFSHQIEGLTLKGFKYPLDSITLKAGSSLGISNEIIEDEGIIEFSKGILLVFESRD